LARTRAANYDDKRCEILRAAARLFSDAGYDRASLVQLADELGVSKARVYHYYDSKEALLVDIIRSHLDDLIAAVTKAHAAAKPGRTRLRAMIGALLDAYSDADAEHAIQIQELKRLPQAIQNDLKDRERRLVRLFASGLSEAVPELDQDGVKLKMAVTMSLFGMLNWKYMWFREGGALTSEAYAELATTLILDGARAAVTV
jgi:TetR/AcrR family transcriptional regulator